MVHYTPSEALGRLPKQFFAGLVAKAQRLISEGHDVINLGQGNPDLPTPEHIVKSMQKAVANPQYHKYSPFRGYPFLKEAAAAFYNREYGVDLDPEHEVAVLFGGKVGLVEISQCLLNEGDLALVPDPGYPDYLSGLAMAKAEIEKLPLLAENQFLPDYRRIAPSRADQAKLMFLNYPNNPTAAVATEAFFEETAAFSRKHEICVVHDFAYGAIGFDGLKPRSFMQTPGAKDVGIEIYTLSKTYNMAGWRVAFAVGNASVIEAIHLLQDHFYVSVFGAVQEAASEALLGTQQCVNERVAVYERRRDILVAGLREAGLQVNCPQGTFFVWLPVPEPYGTEEFADLLLEQAKVVVAPGMGFGSCGEGYVRIGLVAEEARLAEAAERIKQLFH